MAEAVRHILLTEASRFGAETGAGLMRNRCAFTARDMAADWPDAFTYAVVLGWDNDEPDPHPDDDNGAMDSLAAKYGWDAELVAFLRETHRRFLALADKVPATGEPVTEAQGGAE